MAILETILSTLSFIFVLAAACVSPWLFGAWEMWWFWPFAVCVFAAALCFGIRLVAGGSPLRSHRLRFSAAGTTTAVCFAVFVAYAWVRAWQTPVYMDAERSLLLFATPLLLAGVIAIGFSRAQLRALYLAVALNLLCLGLYGIVNHRITGSSRVLWVQTTFTQYSGRATGAYFCPDHYSGLMELLLALAIGILLTPYASGSRRLAGYTWKFVAAFAAVVALYGVWLSQSRGGGLTVLAMLSVAGLVWTAGFKPAVRWGIRLGGLAACVALLVIAWSSGSAYVGRFKEFTPSGASTFDEARRQATDRIMDNPRYGMYSAAVRAWREVGPWVGIGPGMHQHLWFHYAASPDGDRAKGIWPTRPNAEAHSHQVHNDWLQLLEEYGIIGAVLFSAMAGSLLIVLIKGYRSGTKPAVTLGAILCFTAMALHSLVDFNLQIPATTWIFSSVLAAAFAFIQRAHGPT
ncbi:MAG: O-antigen ligase family protein [bacterium]